MTRPPKVLVVDDEPDLVLYLEHVLHRLGYETARAENGSEAIERAALDPPDLILLDVMMPVMDGFAVCRNLREREATRLTPVIVMTALEGIENRVKLLEHGADDVLAKPVDERGWWPASRARSPASASSTIAWASWPGCAITSPSSCGRRSGAWCSRTRTRPASTSRSTTSPCSSSTSAATVVWPSASPPPTSTPSSSATSAASWTASPTRGATSTRPPAMDSWRSSRTAIRRPTPPAP